MCLEKLVQLEMWVHTCDYECAWVQICVWEWGCVCVSVVHVCLCVCVRVCIYVCMWVYVYMCVDIFGCRLCVCVYVCVHVCNFLSEEFLVGIKMGDKKEEGETKGWASRLPMCPLPPRAERMTLLLTASLPSCVWSWESAAPQYRNTGVTSAHPQGF